MSETPYNPDDPALLISRGLDQDLSEAERRRLDEALAESPALRAEAEQFRAVDELVKRWASRSADVESTPFVKTVLAAVESEDDHDLHQIDRWLRGLGRDAVDVDTEEYTAQVLSRLSLRKRQPPRRPLIFRLGVPLAAAAALAMLVTVPRWWPLADTQPRCRIEIARGAFAGDRDADSTTRTVAVVTIARLPRTLASAQSTRSGVSLVSFSSEPIADAFDEFSPEFLPL